MLQLKNIKKEYNAGEDKVEALRGINIEFRDNEFVSILGPSGCGKTTMLNIIGGLDHYTDGDLIISGRSTKEFKDRDWDVYRNHKVGFVFQSYNLIMHQSVLSNVELALTLSGVSRTERRERAKEALKKVGLSDQINKKPNQMSGGQMQRVAIARALVNDPEILLADEPTGALDSVTSVQIMNLLKEIANDRLVIMVTHNPELAEQYSTRIIKLLDGEVVDDSNPYNRVDDLLNKAKFCVTDAKDIPIDDIPYKKPKKKKDKSKKKNSMSFFTALSLSLNNLMTKKARTALTSFAGSIGIIGIALILSISSGLQLYIDKVQEDTLSSYPISILKEDVNVESLINAITSNTGDKEITHDLDKIYSNVVLYELMNSMINTEIVENNLKDFKVYLDNNMSHNAITSVVYGYDMDLNIYKNDMSKVTKLNPSTFMKDFQNMTGSNMGGMSMGMDVWSEMMKGKNGEYVNELVEDQYDVLSGRWPQAYNEVVLVADKNNEINDFVLCMLGFKTEEELKEIIKSAMMGEEKDFEQESWTYDEILNTTYKLVLPTDYYKLDNGKWKNMSDNDAYMKVVLQNATDLKIVGIVKPNEEAVSTSIGGTIGYTYALTEHIVNEVNKTDIVKQQIENPTIDVITGLPFKTDDVVEPTVEEKVVLFKSYVNSLDDAARGELALAILTTISEDEVNIQVNQIMSTFHNREMLENMIVEFYSAQAGVPENVIRENLAKMSDDELQANVRLALSEEIKKQYETQIKEQIGNMTTTQLGQMLLQKIELSTDESIANMYDKYMPAQYSNSDYDGVLSKLGFIDLDNPAYINIYASTFEAKDEIEQLIKDYNANAKEENKIQYTDYIKLIMSSVSTIINAISYILIAFVSISLVVSSIMIGIITYISVLERTKEIGVLRAIGASKKDVSRVFNAETLIVGFASGMFGIITTLILNIPINIIVKQLTDISNIAVLPVAGAIALVLISMGLTLIAGLLPSRIAAKKDPVVALRSE
jgi:putative ABC transport system permease protein